MTKHTLEGLFLDDDRVEVYLDGQWLDPRPSQKVWNKSPDGFQWGYAGSGPSQLAMAIMLKLTGDIKHFQDFKFWLITNLPFNHGFEIVFDLDEFYSHLEAQHG